MRGLLSYGRGTQDIERVTLRIKTNSSGDIYLPTAGYSIEGTQNCPYNWYVSIDGGEDTTYAGTGSSSGAIRVGYGLRPGTIHTVTIKPVIDDFLWCRALGYKGSTHAPYLINIISDKSYKGYAFNAIFSGDYYKAYQYQGCTNLLNTDDELLPNTLEIIGSNYRAYEYSGCTSLKNNAEEKILKSVKCIGDNYRAYQYQNCTSINKIGIRAINWSSVGSGYRSGMFSGACSTANPANITIEGGICEGGSWGLVDNRVKTIKVYSGLVNDYKALLTGITSTKISANPIWDTNDYEFLEFSINADSNGDIKIPIAGYSTSGAQDCAYDWMVSVDGEEAVEYTGTGSTTAIAVGEGTAGSSHRIIISPKTIDFGWGRAFGFYDSGIESLITEFVHDSYKCFATSTTGTGNYYKYRTFYGCSNLVNSYEKLPTSVTTVGDYALKECYKNCTSLTSAFWEVIHRGITIGTDYRASEYEGCSSLSTYQGIAGYLDGTYPTNYKNNMFYGAGNNMVMYITRLEKMYSDVLGLSNSRINNIKIFVDDLYYYTCTTPWASVSASKFRFYYFDYKPIPAPDLTKYTTLVGSYTMPYRASDSNYSYNIGGWAEYARGFSSVQAGSHDVRVPGSRNSRYDGRVLGNTYRVRWEGATGGVAIDTGVNNDYGTGTGGSIDGNVRGFNQDYKGNMSYARGYESSSGVVYKEIGGRPAVDRRNEHFSGWYAVFATSRDGRWVWAENKRYYSPTKWGSATVNVGTYSGSFTNIEFSDDGLTAYCASSFGTITQYNLSAPWDLNTKVSTGKTKSVNGGFALSKDYKYLYVYNGTLTVYQYTE